MGAKRTSLAASVLFLMLFAITAKADVINGSFETGDASGWTLSASAKWMGYSETTSFNSRLPIDDASLARYQSGIVSAGRGSLSYFVDPSLKYNPVEGSDFLLLSNSIGPSSYSMVLDGIDYYFNFLQEVKLNQSIYMNKGDVVSGWTSMTSEEWGGFQYDSAWVDIQGKYLGSTPIYMSCQTAIKYETSLGQLTPWLYWSWTAPESDLYDLSLNVRNDTQGSTFGLFDDIHVTPVPEPPTLLLLGSGLAGLIGCGRRR